MSDRFHTVVWVDHREATVFRFSADAMSEVDIHSHTALQRLHHSRTGSEAGGTPPDDQDFFERIAAVLEPTDGTVITGPGNAKSALKTFIDRSRSNEISRVFAVETVDDHPEKDVLLALGRRYLSRLGPGAIV